ncbi:hypothetical protein ACA910_008352 [Epithemia clementina (nom. ined.)]
MLANGKNQVEGYTVYYTHSCNTPLPGLKQPSPLLYLCLREELENKDESNELALPACMKEFFRQWLAIAASASSQSIIVSDEHLFNTSPQRYNALLQLLSKHFDVTVVAFYRNFVESAVSLYAQRLKRVLEEPNGWPLLTSSNKQNKNKNNPDLYPDARAPPAPLAAALPDFLTFLPLEAARLVTTSRNNTNNNTLGLVVPRDPYQRMANQGANPPNVQFRLLNFEEKSMDIVTQFICLALPHVTPTCRQQQSQPPLPPRNGRSASSHVVDSLAVAVYRQGLLPAAHQPNQRRSEVIRVLYKFVLQPYLNHSSPLPPPPFSQNMVDTSITPTTLTAASTLWMQQQAPLLWNCPTQHQWASIREATLAKAMSAFHYFEKIKNKIKNKEEWIQQELLHVYKAAQSGLLCHLDGNLLLANQTWRKAIVQTLSSSFA